MSHADMHSYNKFAEIYALNDLGDSNYDASPEYNVPIAREKAANLRARRQQLAIMRNELLVSLQVVNSIERDVVDGEWMTWLGEELYRCDQASHILAATSDEILGKRVGDIEKLREYCMDCNRIWGNVKERFTELS